LLAEFEGKLPYEVPTSSALGQEQLAAKELLENYNKGQMTLDCAPGRKAGIGSISGVVSEATRGRPVEGALVLATLDGTPQRSVTTDANGLYAMLGLTPGTYVLEAFNPPFPPSHIEDIEVVGQQHTVVDFRLALPPPPEEEGAIGGTVIDARTGEPTGVPVEILVLQDGEPLPVTGSARPSSGAFLVEGIPAGTYSVSAFALGYRLSQLDGVEVQAGQPTIVDLELLPLSNAEAGLIQGTLTVNGVPAAGINPGPGLAPPIVVQLMLGDHILASAIPDQRGQYVLRGVPAGSYSLAGEVFTPLLSVRVDDVAVGMGEQVVVDLGMTPKKRTQS
jgi:hypothetical protein